MLDPWCYFCSLLIFISFVTGYANELPVNMSTVVVDTNGRNVPVRGAIVNSMAYENDTDLITREDKPARLSDAKMLHFTNTTVTNSNSTIIVSEDLHKCKERLECSLYHQQVDSCPYTLWDIPMSFWGTAYDLFRMTGMCNCAVVAGSKGLYYYKYYPVAPKCSSTIHQKTITSAMRKAIYYIEDPSLYNVYFFHINHERSYVGDIMIGTSISTWFAGAKWAQYKGGIYIGSSVL